MLDNEPEWMFPAYGWKYYGSILHDSVCYAEFEIACIVRGYVNPDVNLRNDTMLSIHYRYEPYERFIMSEACNYRGSGKMSAKARRFRDELIKRDIENGDRDKDGTIIPTKDEIENSPGIYEWCKSHHPNFLKIRNVEHI